MVTGGAAKPQAISTQRSWRQEGGKGASFVILAENKSFPEAPSADLRCVSLAAAESHVQSWRNGGIAVNRLDRAVYC